jgi:hypothetical protein
MTHAQMQERRHQKDRRAMQRILDAERRARVERCVREISAQRLIPEC